MRRENSDKGGAFKKFAVAAGLSVLVAAIFDLLFYGCSGINLNAALFLLALFILGVPIKKGYYSGKARIATVTVTAVFLLSAFWDANLINVFGTLTGLLIIRFGALYGDNSRTLGWLPRLFLYCSTFWADLIVYLSDNAKKFSLNAVRLAFVSLTVFVTAVLAVVFFSLFAVASPQISSMLSRLGEMLSDFDLNFPRAVLWAVVALSSKHKQKEGGEQTLSEVAAAEYARKKYAIPAFQQKFFGLHRSDGEIFADNAEAAEISEKLDGAETEAEKLVVRADIQEKAKKTRMKDKKALIYSFVLTCAVWIVSFIVNVV